uniref:Uncharacterized protein n=1 Tax=Pithovirus LCPAC406 TaxID=2506599 RepID=A0A481ZIS1_9VIRU|nr:MAG: hypothetical protein LCPAC406_03450 [Pithovirus LCPAC406]
MLKRSATDNSDLTKYLQFQLKISEIDEDIALQGGDYPGIPYKGGIPELEIILKEIVLLQKRTERMWI